MRTMRRSEERRRLARLHLRAGSTGVAGGTLLPRFVETRVYQLLLEAVASEFGARMTAMTNATKNADEQIDNLTLIANRTRQANITKELLDIVGGAEALNG